MNDKEKPEIEDKNVKIKFVSSVQVMFVGALSGIISAIFLQPLNVLKTRLQNPVKSLKNYDSHRIIAILSHVRKHEKLSVLWAGTVPTILRNIPGGGIYFFVYDTLKKKFYSTHPPNSLDSLMLGIVTRAVTDLSIVPITVVKTRVESGVYKYGGVVAAIKDIYRNEGARGLTSGLVPMLLRDCPMSGIYVCFYNNTQSRVPKDFYADYPATCNSSCAAVSGVLASIATHPPDVLKTQMQLFPHKYSSIWAAAVSIYKEHGIEGYYQGIIPRLLKRTIFAVISWPLYEKVAQKKEREPYKIKYD